MRGLCTCCNQWWEKLIYHKCRVDVFSGLLGSVNASIMYMLHSDVGNTADLSGAVSWFDVVFPRFLVELSVSNILL